MKGDDEVRMVHSEREQGSYLGVILTGVVFTVTIISAVIFSMYVLKRIDAVEKDVSLTIS